MIVGRGRVTRLRGAARRRWCGCLAAVAAACGNGARKGRAPEAIHGDAQVARSACANDAAECPGACNAQGYCESDQGFGPEVRLPPARYAVDYELRAHQGIMNKDPALLVLAEPLWVSKRESSVGDCRRCKDCKPKAFLEGVADDVPLELSFVDAQAFCKATGRRLATPEEWQAAARGPSPCTDPNEVFCSTNRLDLRADKTFYGAEVTTAVMPALDEAIASESTGALPEQLEQLEQLMANH